MQRYRVPYACVILTLYSNRTTLLLGKNERANNHPITIQIRDTTQNKVHHTHNKHT